MATMKAIRSVRLQGRFIGSSFLALGLFFFLAITAHASPAILDVRDVDTPGEDSELHVGGLTDGVSGFVDRDNQDWTNIPLILEGADYIESAQDNADVSDDRGTSLLIEVDVAQGAVLYMFIDDAQPATPFPWMNSADFGADWEDTGLDVSWNFGDPGFSVWRTVGPVNAGTYNFRQMPTDSSFYGIAATFESVPVDIDIRPLSKKNRIRPGSWGLIPVAILGSVDFDALQIDLSTVRFGRNEAKALHWFSIARDINHDGFSDLVLLFKNRETGIVCGDTEAELTGAASGGQRFIGTDNVKTIDCIVNGTFEAGDLRGWTASGINDGFATINQEGTCFSFNNTTGLTLNGNFAANVRSSGPAPTSSIGILTSDPFVARSGIRFRALSENTDDTLATDPVTLEVAVLDSAGSVLLSQVVKTNIVTLNPLCPEGELRDGTFSKHFIDTSSFAGQEIRLEFRQHTNVAGHGFFTLIDDVDYSFSHSHGR